jgi:hypothetical protein
MPETAVAQLLVASGPMIFGGRRQKRQPTTVHVAVFESYLEKAL